MNHNPVEAANAIRLARKSAMEDPSFSLRKAIGDTFSPSSSAISGLTYYDLEPGAKFLYPVPTPLRNMIPRESGKGGIQANWRSITAINSGNTSGGVSSGNRGGVISVTTKDVFAIYKTIGLESNVEFEAQWVARGFEDVQAVATRTLLEATMIVEEKMMLGGDTGFPLGQPGLPNLADSSTGGALLNSTAYYVTCVPLTLDGYANTTVSANGAPGQVTRLNAGGSSDTFGGGAGKVSAEATITTSSSGSNTHSITASLTTPVVGAVGYAWYLGTATTVERIVAVTSISSVVMTALPASTNQLSSSLGTNDNSQNALAFDGLIYQAFAAGSGAYVAAVNGTLTADNAGGVVEIETMLKSMYDQSRLGPQYLLVSSQGGLDISKKILAGGSTGAQRFVFQSAQDMLQGGIIIREYLNRYTNEIIKIMVHPNMPPGMVVALSMTVPYPMSNVQNVVQVRTLQDYYQIQWPLVQRKWEYGCYANEVLQHYFPPSMGVLYNITPG